MAASNTSAELGRIFTLVGLGIQLFSFSFFIITLIIFGCRVYVNLPSIRHRLQSSLSPPPALLASLPFFVRMDSDYSLTLTVTVNLASPTFGRTPHFPETARFLPFGYLAIARTGQRFT
jgi:hypothetical protein